MPEPGPLQSHTPTEVGAGASTGDAAARAGAVRTPARTPVAAGVPTVAGAVAAGVPTVLPTAAVAAGVPTVQPTVLPTGRVFLAPAESDGAPRSSGARTYACSFMAAGRVKRADQTLSDWLIPADVIAQAEPLFNAVPSYLDHPELYGFGSHQEPKVANLVGVTLDAEWSEDRQAMLGRLRLYDRAEGSPGWLVGTLFDQILEDKAAGNPVPPVGLSAVFFHKSRLDETTGFRTTHAIEHIESVDVVYDPGAAGYIKEALSAIRPRAFYLATQSQGGSPMTEELETIQEPSVTVTAGVPTVQPTVQPPQAPVGAPLVGARPSQTSTAEPAEAPASDGAGVPVGAGVPTALHPPDPRLDQALQQIELMGQQVQHLTTLLARNQDQNVITGMEAQQANIRGMLSSLDKVEQAIEAMLDGTRPAGGIQPLSGVRELYTLLSGDYEMTGRFNPDRVYLANVTCSTMAGLVANALNKRVMNEFATYPKWWEPAVTIQDFATLQEVKWITLGGIGELSTVAEGQAYNELTWDDQTETADFVKKGGYLGLTIEAMDKDDTRRLRAAPRALAQAAWLTLGKTIAALFTANSGYGSTMSDTNQIFDSSNHSNQGTSAFSHTSWVATKLAMQKITELNSGERLGALLKPKFIWVPVDLEASAIAELASGEGEIGSADYNVNEGAFADSLTARLRRARERVITVPFWTDTADWVVQADPRLYPGLGLGFRYGRTPEIFSVASPTAGLMFTNDTMPVKVRFFFATGFIDYRPWYKHIVS